MPHPFISIICPVYNEEEHIEKCIESILQQDYPKENIELFFVDGMSTDRTREIINSYTKQYTYMYLLDNPEQRANYAMNRGIREAKGEYVIRLDAHSSYPNDYCSKLIHYAIELQADNVGGVWITQPAKNTIICRAIALASSHFFGVGNSIHKIGAKKIVEADTVPFGCYKRDVFTQIGLYDEELTCNEDEELNARITHHGGGKIFLIPDIAISYMARDTWHKMCKMYYQYGLFKPLVNKKIRKPVSIRQFFPVLFLCGLVFGALLSVFFNTVFLIYGAIIALYFLMGVCVGIGKIKSCNDVGLAIILPVTFFLIHVSYGWGYLNGLYKIMTHSKFHATVNR